MVLCRILFFMCLLLSSCISRQEFIGTFETKENLALMQTRTYETNDRLKLLRSVMDAMQDMGFLIVSTNEEIGSISGVKRSGYYLSMDVFVTPVRHTQFKVTLSPQYNRQVVSGKKFYQDYFANLSTAMGSKPIE